MLNRSASLAIQHAFSKPMAIWCPGSESVLDCVSIPDLFPLPYCDYVGRVGFFYHQIHVFTVQKQVSMIRKYHDTTLYSRHKNLASLKDYSAYRNSVNIAFLRLLL